jgi:hypothetical protein
MKTKFLITITLITFAVLFYSFTSSNTGEGVSTAIVQSTFGKNEGFSIIYGDGTSELIPFKFKSNTENKMESSVKMAGIINQLKNKGFKYVGLAGHSNFECPDASCYSSYMLFEKN